VQVSYGATCFRRAGFRKRSANRCQHLFPSPDFFSMIASGSAVQMKGLGLSLVSTRYRLMAVWRSTMPLRTRLA